MIGNDVVDLKRALQDSNWQRKGYLEKLFSREEQHRIACAADPNQMVWLLWSMKEASYKVHFRQHLVRSFQPQKISCTPDVIEENTAHGHVEYDGQLYFSRSRLTEYFIHTVSVAQPVHFKGVKIKFDRVCDVNLDQFLKKNDLQAYSIIKDDHLIPTLLNRDTGERLFLSISHHGRYLSLAYRSKTKAPTSLSLEA